MAIYPELSEPEGNRLLKKLRQPLISGAGLAAKSITSAETSDNHGF